MKTERERITDVKDVVWSIWRRMEAGCGNHNCRIMKPTGWALNGPCRCTTKIFAQQLRDIADSLEGKQ